MKKTILTFVLLIALFPVISSYSQNVYEALPIEFAKPSNPKDNPYLDLSPLLKQSDQIAPTIEHNYARESNSYKILFSENFDSNKNNWDITNTELRKTQITGGKLFDYFGEMGLGTLNLIPVNFDKSVKHRISFSIANLNNKKGYKYEVYEKKSNGKLKVRFEANPIWGFVWGFKDWNNCHVVLFQKMGSVNSIQTKYTVYSIIGGNKIVHREWYRDLNSDLNNETNFNEIIVENDGGKTYLYTKNNGVEHMLTGCASSDWFDKYMGPYIGAGANICMDYLKVEKIIP